VSRVVLETGSASRGVSRKGPIMAFVYRPTYYKTDPKTGEKKKRKQKKWYVRYKDADGKLKTVPGYTDGEATKQKAARLEKKTAQQREGIITKDDEQQSRPQHVKRTIAQCLAVLDGCRFRYLADVQESAVEEFLAGLRQHKERTLDPGKEWYTAKELAALCDIAPESVSRFARRAGLQREGRGRAQRYHRDIAATLLERHGGGAGIETSNHYLVAMKSFCRWLVKDRRATINPLAHLSKLNSDVDVRGERRALTEEAFHRFIAAAGQGKPFRGLTGQDRVVLYTLAAMTGFRANELASLTPSSFSLAGRPTTATVKAAYSKHRREDVQLLRADVA
jgi:hypothetical protein